MIGLFICIAVVLAIEIAVQVLGRRKPRPQPKAEPARMARDDSEGWVRTVVDERGNVRLVPGDTGRQVPWIWRGRRRWRGGF